MRQECPICETVPAQSPGIWKEIESQRNFEQLPLAVEVHHPSHDLRIGINSSLVRWDYSKKEILYLGEGNFHQGIMAVENAFAENISGDDFVWTLRPFAVKLRQFHMKNSNQV